MRRRILVSLTILLASAVALVVGYWLLQPHPRIDQASLDKIQIGMTEREVIDIIGAPAGNHGLGEAELDFGGGWLVPFVEDSERKSWLGQEFAIHVSFDANGKVSEKILLRVWRPYDSQFDMLCQMTGLKQKKSRPNPGPIF